MKPRKTYFDMEKNKEYLFDPKSKEGSVKAEIQDIFDEMKEKDLFEADKLKYGFFSAELSHKLFLIYNNKAENKEIIIDYLMENIIDRELKREDIIFMFISNKTIKTKTGERNIKESLVIRTNYYKSIQALVNNKIKKIIPSINDRISATTHKEIFDEIDKITQYSCFDENFSKNKISFEVKKRQIIQETLKSIFGENTNIIIPRSFDADIKISKTNQKAKIDLENLEEKIFKTKDDLRIFIRKSTNSLGSDSVLTGIPSNDFFSKQNFANKISDMLRHNKEIKNLGLSQYEINTFSIKLVEKDLLGENIMINTIVNKLLNMLNSGSSKGLGFYNYIMKTITGKIPVDLQRKIDPKTRIRKSREYVQNQRELQLKKISQIRPSLVEMYETNVLRPLVEALKIYMLK